MQCPERENLVAGKKMQTGGVLGNTGLQDLISFSIKTHSLLSLNLLRQATLLKLFRKLADDARTEHVGHMENLCMDVIESGNVRSPISVQAGGNFSGR